MYCVICIQIFIHWMAVLSYISELDSIGLGKSWVLFMIFFFFKDQDLLNLFFINDVELSLSWLHRLGSYLMCLNRMSWNGYFVLMIQRHLGSVQCCVERWLHKCSSGLVLLIHLLFKACVRINIISRIMKTWH